MILSEVERFARTILDSMGLSFFNLIFYNMPIPHGLWHRNGIGLSIPFCHFNDLNQIDRLVTHECCHALLGDSGRSNSGHGAKWIMEMAAWGGRPHEDYCFDATYARMRDQFLRNANLVAASEKRIKKVVDLIDQWADAGIQRRTDFLTFASEITEEEISLVPKPGGAKSDKSPCRNNCLPTGEVFIGNDGKLFIMARGASGPVHSACGGCADRILNSLPRPKSAVSDIRRFFNV